MNNVMHTSFTGDCIALESMAKIRSWKFHRLSFAYGAFLELINICTLYWIHLDPHLQEQLHMSGLHDLLLILSVKEIAR